ncbi:MAG TPA: autotransporter-associated beta strand repeat-containing protein, partial [Kiritimatiellia bacterium]|nr:autotransporter-associated beta strand repeat-containing protein [Kiritimatiellia bacterium]
QPRIALDANASIGGTSRLDVRRNQDVAGTLQPRFELNGYTLTVKGDAKLAPDLRSSISSTNFFFAITSADVLVSDPAAPERHGTFAVAPGSVFTIESSSTLAGDTNTLVTVPAGGVFDVHNLAAPVPWRIQAEAGSALRTRSGFSRDTRNVLTGPIETSGSGDLVLTDTASSLSLTLTGPVSGPAGITSYGDTNSIVYLLASNNTYQGETTVTRNRHMLFAAYPSSLPGWDSGKLHVYGGGLLGASLAETSAEGFTRAHFDSLVYGDLIPSDGGVFFDTSRLSDPDILLSDPVNKGFGKTGPGDLTILAPVSAWVFAPEDGLTDFRDPGPHTLGYVSTASGSLLITNDIDVTVGVVDAAAQSTFAADLKTIHLGSVAGKESLSNRIGNAATVTAPDIGYNVRQTYFIVGQNGRAALDITDDALLSATLYAGRSSTAAGAIYQSGNSVVTNTTGAYNDGGLGTAANSYGYYGLESGFNHTKGYWQVAQAQYSQGILRQTGGTFTMPGGSTPGNNNVGDYYGGSVTLTRGGYGFAFLLGGSFYHGGTFGVGGDGNSGSNTGSGALVVAGDADARINGPVDLGRADANAKDRRSDLVLAGNGRLTANRINAASNPGWKGASFNGGTLVCTNAEIPIFSGTLAGHNAVIHEGGFTVEVPATAPTGKTIDVPLCAPTGLMAVDMTFDTPLTDYIAPPVVINKYNGPDGPNGYVAEALFDRPSGSVTGIRFHAPGRGMSPQPIATLRQAGRSDVDVTLSVKPAVSGGFTKTGDGNVTFTAANTYTGPTLVREGTLSLGRADALSSATAITVGGTGASAKLDLNGYAIAAAALTLEDGGAIVNGTVSAASIIKTGAGTATLAATPAVAAPPVPALDAPTPGLWEGLTSRTANDPYRYTPKQNIRLTTYAGNGGNSANTSNSGGMWAGNNHTYAYAGCIWNRTATNQVWNFRGAFDDYVYLVIDRSLVLYRNGNSGPSTGTFTATPGPHYFDARFGDGSGNVGCNLTGMMDSGLNWDPGDGAGWRIVTDPGNGSVLTTSSVNWDAAEAARNALPGVPGLFEGTVGGCGNSVEPNPCDGGVQLTPRAANGTVSVPAGNNQSAALSNGYVWWNYASAVYSGYVWNRSGTNEMWTFIQNLDDACLIVIDGQTVLSGRLNDTATRIVTVPVTPGPHAFEVRFGQHAGGAGGSVIPGSGFGIDLQGRHTTDSANFVIPYAYGNGMPDIYTEAEPFFTTTLNGYVETPSAVQVEAGTLALLSDLTPGLLFGEVDGNKNWNAMPNTTTVDLATSVANVYGSPGHGDTFTLVYTGAIWNRTGQDVTWSFMMDYDDGGRLIIDRTNVVIFAADSCKTMTGTVTLPPGPHAIELRFTENGGGDGPWSGVIPWAIGIKVGAASTTWQDYAMLADPGDGSLLTTSMPADYSDDSFDLASGATLDLGGGECAIGTLTGDGTVANGTFAAGSIYRVKIDGATSTCVTFDGVDLANLTVMPADAASAEPTATTYVIATGSINTKPALSGFPSKYKLIVGGNGTQLLLTSQGGAVLLLK